MDFNFQLLYYIYIYSRSIAINFKKTPVIHQKTGFFNFSRSSNRQKYTCCWLDVFYH